MAKPASFDHVVSFPQVVIEDVVALLKAAIFFSVSLDEVSSLLVQYMCIHVYILDKNFKRIALYLQLSPVGAAPNADNLTALLVDKLQTTGGLSAEEIACKLVNVTTDGAPVVQGSVKGLVTQVRRKLLCPAVLLCRC